MGSAPLRLAQLQVPPDLARMVPGVALWALGHCIVMVGREWVNEERTDVRWHLSISNRTRYPTWAEIGEARDRLLPPDVWLCMPMPPRAYWLSLHPNCFHLWEIRDANLIEQWKYEGEHARLIGAGVPQPESHG